jgi:tetratricopeptide (TPR) repeat protein
MTVRFRRSMKIAPGVKINLTKTGWGVTAGPRGAHYSVNSSGIRTRSVGLPGTGLYYQERSSSSKRAAGGSSQPVRTPARPVPPVRPVTMVPKPGIFASAAEMAYHRGVLAYFGGDHPSVVAAFEQALAAEPSATSAHLFAGVSLTHLDGQEARAARHLEAVVSSPTVMPDRLQLKYLRPSVFDLQIGVKITEAITARAPASEFGATLLLAEVYQATGRLDEAIGLITQVHEAMSDPLVRLSLCDLLLADGDFAGVVETAAGVTNDSDVGVETLHVVAAAQIAMGQNTGAMESFREALAKTSGRDPVLLMAVRYDRALAYEHIGQTAKSRADLERIYGADPRYEDVAARLGAARGR